MGFRFREFPIYQEIRVFIREIYKLSSTFPEEERFGLISQIKRAAASVLLNIAEGATRKSDAEFNRFLMISIGSVSEIVAVLDIALDQGYINESNHQKILLKCEKIAKQLYGFSRKLREK